MSNLCFSDKGMSKGFSAIEGLIALAILSVIAVSTYSAFSNIRSSAKRVSNNNICETHLKKIFSKIDDQKLDTTVAKEFLDPVYPANYTTLSQPFGTNLMSAPTTPTLASAADSALKARLASAGITANGLYAKRPSAVISTLTIKNNGTTSYMPLLANNRMGYLADLYNNGHHAKDGLTALPVELQPPVEDTVNNLNQGSFNKRYKTNSKIKLELYSLKDKTVVSDIYPYFFPMPSSQYPERDASNAVTKYFPNSRNEVIMAQFPDWMHEDLGIRVTLNSEIRDAISNDLIQNCENFTNFEYQKKIQNTIDFGDFDTIRYSGGTSTTSFNVNSVKQDTWKSSNKISVLSPPSSDQTDLAPLFTNYNAQNPNLGRDRNLCSQQGQNLNDIFIKFKIKNISNEPGFIPLCIDTSVQWLSAEAAQGWCPKGGYSYASQSFVKINYDWKPGDLGWVPCESLKFCGQTPDRVDVIHSSNSLEYQYHYSVVADNNNSGNRLWGCELKYMAATVDVAGNLSYPPAKKADFSSLSTTDQDKLISKLNTETITEINPKIYFKPPPCYLCSCKSCKSGKGGLFGSLFSLFLFVVLVVATGGLGAAAMITAATTATVVSTLTVLCAFGNLGCDSGGGASSTPYTAPSGNQFTSCSDSNITHCSCGSTCNKKKVPAPHWIDSLETTDTSAIAANLAANSCSFFTGPKALMGSAARIVNLTFSYKSKIPSLLYSKLPAGQFVQVPNSADTYYQIYDFKDDGVTPEYKFVQNMDEVIWQEFDRSAGVYCVSRQICKNGVWDSSKQPWSYDDAAGTPHSYGLTPLEGCFPVKTGYSIDWNNNSLDPLKPNRKSPLCIAVDFPTGVFNETSETLQGYNDLNYECADVGGLSTPPSSLDFPDLTGLPGNRRIVGRPYNPRTCATSSNYSDALGNLTTITLAGPDGIGDGTSCPTGGRFDYLNHQRRKSKYKKMDYIYQLLVNQGNAAYTFTPAGCENLQCWAQCVPPRNLPQGPLSGEEQLYYETYVSSAHQNLPFCNGMNRLDFDSIR